MFRKQTRQPRRITLYTKPVCPLCEKAKVVLKRVARDLPLIIEEINILEDPALFKRYELRIPVTAVEGRAVFEGGLSEIRLRRWLSQNRPAAPRPQDQ